MMFTQTDIADTITATGQLARIAGLATTPAARSRAFASLQEFISLAEVPDATRRRMTLEAEERYQLAVELGY